MNKTIISIFPISSAITLKKPVFASKNFWFLMFVLAFALMVCCIFQINAQTRESYLIIQYQQQISLLTEQNKALEIDYSKTSSLRNIGDFMEKQEFVRSNQIEYVQLLGETAFAK
jgi:hypothetical protein